MARFQTPHLLFSHVKGNMLLPSSDLNTINSHSVQAKHKLDKSRLKNDMNVGFF